MPMASAAAIAVFRPLHVGGFRAGAVSGVPVAATGAAADSGGAGLGDADSGGADSGAPDWGGAAYGMVWVVAHGRCGVVSSLRGVVIGAPMSMVRWSGRLSAPTL
jgi:hypothetical protein